MTAPVVRLFLANGCNALQSLEVELQLKIILFLGVLTAGILLFLTCLASDDVSEMPQMMPQ